MTLKKKIDAAAFDALPEAVQSLYKEDGDDFVLDIEADEDDNGGDDLKTELERIKLKRDLESEHRKTAETRLRDVQKQLKELEKRVQEDGDNKHRKAGDVEALDKSWKEKFEAREAELIQEADSLRNGIKEVLVHSKAVEIASRISSVPDLLAPVIASRLTVDYGDGKPQTRVVDAAGNLSASTLQDLEKEIAGDKRFASVIIAGNGSGGGGRGNPGKGGAPDKKLSEMSEQELIDWQKRDPEGFRKASGINF